MSFDISEVTYSAWKDCVDELARHYNEINERNAKEVLSSSHFGDQEDEGQVKALIDDAKERCGS